MCEFICCFTALRTWVLLFERIFVTFLSLVATRFCGRFDQILSLKNSCNLAVNFLTNILTSHKKSFLQISAFDIFQFTFSKFFLNSFTFFSIFSYKSFNFLLSNWVLKLTNITWTSTCPDSAPFSTPKK